MQMATIMMKKFPEETCLATLITCGTLFGHMEGGVLDGKTYFH